jgi:hypothetical protein
MNLPARFLADLPPEATLSAEMITSACQALRRNHARTLGQLSTEQAAGLIAETAKQWLREDYPFRRLAVAFGPEETGYSPEVLQHGLDVFFREWTMEHLHALLLQDLGVAQRLDGFGAVEAEQRMRQSSLVTAPELLVHICAGNLPVPAMTSMLLGLLIRSAQFVKCASNHCFFPRLLAHSLVDTEPSVAAALELAAWPGGSTALEEALFANSDAVTATGSDEALQAIQRRLPGRVRFVGYGHRVSFGYITREALGGFGRAEILEKAATDIIAWDQNGCLSPHLFYVENGGLVSVEQFAEELAATLARREASHPRGRITIEESTTITLKRDFYSVRAAAMQETRLWPSADSTAWTVVFEADPQFQLSCLNRFVYVKPVSDLAEALRSADAVRGKVSTVGLATVSHRQGELATQLARWGVTRVCPLGRMQQPPLTWRHDGRPSLGELVTWTNLESS